MCARNQTENGRKRPTQNSQLLLMRKLPAPLHTPGKSTSIDPVVRNRPSILVRLPLYAYWSVLVVTAKEPAVELLLFTPRTCVTTLFDRVGAGGVATAHHPANLRQHLLTAKEPAVWLLLITPRTCVTSRCMLIVST